MNYEETVRALHDLLGDHVSVDIMRRDKSSPAGVPQTIAHLGGELRRGEDTAYLGASITVGPNDEELVFLVGPSDLGRQSYFILRDSLTVGSDWNTLADPPRLVIDTAGVTIAVGPLREDFRVATET